MARYPGYRRRSRQWEFEIDLDAVAQIVAGAAAVVIIWLGIAWWAGWL